MVPGIIRPCPATGEVLWGLTGDAQFTQARTDSPPWVPPLGVVIQVELVEPNDLFESPSTESC